MGKWIQDAGHGGTDSGAVANGITEKVITLEAATYVNARLKEHGLSSTMTRTTDKTLEPNERTSIVKNSGASCCLSHHINAGGGEGAEFIISIYSDGKLGNLLAESFKKSGYPVRKVYSRKNSSGSDYYFMHRLTGSVQTIIVEYEFLDGDNADKLKDKSYREGMYEAVVRAVCQYEGITYKAKTVTSSEWKKVNNKWYYYKNGQMVKSQWIQDDGSWYYLKADGAMAAGEWVLDKGEWYWLKSDGRMASLEWIEYDGGWYWADKSGAAARGWRTMTNGKRYYFHPKATANRKECQMAYDEDVPIHVGPDGVSY